MRARPAMLEKEAAGPLRERFIHVERDLKRASYVVSYELPFEEMASTQDRDTFEKSLIAWQTVIVAAFLAQWDREHSR